MKRIKRFKLKFPVIAEQYKHGETPFALGTGIVMFEEIFYKKFKDLIKDKLSSYYAFLIFTINFLFISLKIMSWIMGLK